MRMKPLLSLTCDIKRAERRRRMCDGAEARAARRHGHVAAPAAVVVDDCRGWLWMKDRHKWNKFWFVLDSDYLQYYTHPDDDSYTGQFYLSDFLVVPLKKLGFGSHKHAFRIQDSDGGSFTFAARHNEDRVRWLNKLRNVSRVGGDVSETSQTPGDAQTGARHDEVDDDGDDDDDDDKSVDNDVDRRTDGSDESDICELLETLHRSHVSVFGGPSDVTAKRRTIWYTDTNDQASDQRQQQPIPTVSSSSSSSSTAAQQSSMCSASDATTSRQKTLRWLVVQRRTLKDKEHQLAAVEHLLSRETLDSTTLRRFMDEQQDNLQQFMHKRTVND